LRPSLRPPDRQDKGGVRRPVGARSSVSGLVAKLQRARNRSSAGHPVDNPVNQRWNVRE